MSLLRKISMLRPALARLQSTSSLLHWSEEAAAARVLKKPIVVLESTIITHGMPYPHNLETAIQVEDIIRNEGATPATVAILSGRLHIGLTQQQLEYLSQARGVVKASRRDLAPVMAAQKDGATTVAGTIVAAELGGVDVFVTGGIGGVHREGELTLDVSADLTELGRSRTLVVCSGVKSILDIPRTLEYLETQGVTVCSYGTEEFPAFYTPRSGCKAPHRVSDAAGAAQVLLAARRMHLASGIVVAVPVPQEHAMDDKVINDAIKDALDKAKILGVSGKEVTPFILAAVAKATEEKDIALIKNNAKVGAQIAVEYNRLRNDRNSNIFSNSGGFLGDSRKFHTCTRGYATRAHADFPMFRDVDLDAPVLVVGGANFDRTYRVTESAVKLDGSTHGCWSSGCGGGVGRNMAEALWRLRGGRGVQLLAAVGDDDDGRILQDIAPGMLLDGCVVKGRTANYASVLDSQGECLLGLGDMAVHDLISIDMVNRHMSVLERAPLVVLDGNPPQETVDYVLDTCQQLQKPVFFEPTDKRKAVKVFKNTKHTVNFASPNINELRAMAFSISPSLSTVQSNDIEEIKELASIVSKFIHFLIITRGSKGVITINNAKNTVVHNTSVMENIVSVSGAGDCFASGFIYGILNGMSEKECVTFGFKAAKAALTSERTVPITFHF